MELGYWEIHGLAQSIRFMLHAAGQDYKEKFYKLANRPEWIEQDKPEIAKTNPFANLPYLKHDNRTITESRAILKYLADQLNFGTDADLDTLFKAEMTYGVLDELWAYFRTFVFTSTEDFEKDNHKVEFHQKILQKFQVINDFLAQQKSKFVTGDSLKWVDFVLYENFIIFSKFSGVIASLPELARLEQDLNKTAGVDFVAYVAKIKAEMPILLPKMSPIYFQGSIDQMIRQVEAL